MYVQVTFVLSLVVLCQGHRLPAAPPGDSSSLSEQNLIYHEHLSDVYELFWNFNKTHIIFKTEVKTNGYIGFGLSPNGAMAHSDVIIGWVKDGNSFFHDRHAEGHSKPEIDTQQDWFLLSATEVGNVTSLTFIRKLETCDSLDRPITNDTTRIIFSYSPTDPVDKDTIAYHGQTRHGTKSIMLLTPPTSQQTTQPLPSDVITVELLNENYPVPGTWDTVYRCKVFKLPDFGEKHHLIKYEPVIQPGHELLVHHILIYYCGHAVNTSHAGESYLCYDQSPKDLFDCQNTLVAWAVGGKAFEYPAVAGHPMGRPQDPQILIMETHYNNPELKNDFVDNSGLRLYFTKQLRQYDSGLLEIGVVVDYNHIIPPYEASFVSSGHCQANCLQQGLGDQEIRVFADFLHAHLLGRKIRTRYFRNGVEQVPILEDNNYDFNYQEMRKLPEERAIKKGDSFLLECVYDSTGKTSPTFGGLKTSYEMCLAFLLYYPRIDMTRCLSRTQYPAQDMYSTIQSYDWTNPLVRQQFIKTTEDSDVLDMCWFEDQSRTYYKVTPVPKYNQTYTPPRTCPN
ncbi:DBH-like monooxygenase protein 1 [Biomphalaria pfeifferi]|uniref:DBH-like monooxygenase protein 1 n=1 Tax=Biomphalaria pfeifferi TaxID=112525 RepID=A0AAD8ASZ5_BIOPF|nr:DBH-like monooxygenase protein 1 [Biomphalaria pfeifferi]